MTQLLKDAPTSESSQSLAPASLAPASSSLSSSVLGDSNDSIQFGSMAALIEAELKLLIAYLKNALTQIQLTQMTNSAGLEFSKLSADAAQASVKADANNLLAEGSTDITAGATMIGTTGLGAKFGSDAEAGKEELENANSEISEFNKNLNEPAEGDIRASDEEADESIRDEAAIKKNLEERLETGHVLPDDLSDEEKAVLKKDNKLKQRYIEHFRARISDNEHKISTLESRKKEQKDKFDKFSQIASQSASGISNVYKAEETSQKSVFEMQRALFQGIEQNNNSAAGQADSARSDAMQQYLKALQMLTTLDQNNSFRG